MSNSKISKTEKDSGVKTTQVKRLIRKEVSVQFKAEDPTVHYLKITPFYRESQSKDGKKTQTKIVPEIRLSGDWLDKMGFHPEDYVNVIVMNGLLVVRTAIVTYSSGPQPVRYFDTR